MRDPAATRLVRWSIFAIPPLAWTVPRAGEPPAGLETADVAKLLVLVTLTVMASWFLAREVYRDGGLRVPGTIGWFAGFSAFGLLSVLWSPLPVVTIDKAGTMVLLCVLSLAIGVVARSRGDVSRVMWWLSMSLWIFSGINAAVYLYDPTMSGLDRVRIEVGGDGLIHPTAAGSTASLAILILVVCRRVWRFDWTGQILWPAVATHGAILFWAGSRMSLLMLIVATMPWWFAEVTRVRLAIGGLIVAVAATGWMVVDPGFAAAESPAAAVGSIVTRGQSAGEIFEASGRAEMWRAVASEFRHSPWIGHGYFVTSRRGELMVWFHRSNHLAHNMALQSLVTVGVVGTLIFAVALFGIARRTAVLWGSADRFDRRRGRTMATVGCWYAGWSLLAASFLGPVRPESLVFFVMVGLVSANCRSLSPRDERPGRNGVGGNGVRGLQQ